jgi:hypothetical protein
MGSKYRFYDRHKGVMCIKSSNQKGDMLLVSCGNEDDPQIKIWNIKDQSVIGKYAPEDSTQHKPYYYLNVVYLDQEVPFERNLFANPEDSKVKRGFMIVAASIKSVDLFMKNPDEQGYAIINLPTQDDVGSYLASVTTIKHTEDHLTIMIANVSGTVELFKLKFEKSGSNDNTESDDDISNESDELKRQDSKNTKEDHIEIDPDVNLKELIEMRRQKDHFSELDEQSGSQAGQGDPAEAGVVPPRQVAIPEGTVILETPITRQAQSTLQDPSSPTGNASRSNPALINLTKPVLPSSLLNPQSLEPSDIKPKLLAQNGEQSKNI